ncbi:hypothetical protein EJ03DRAFT_88220 [Teratosphaeria nubilosa]|uniref:F-box domain-containing protein n=1 Tax=Teratosphaeria nubilosa TaxID=161662 RepID=A0A6G1LA76_9PEZI|nr:hypothetical protein EJ03DRAFT_88220 [Teratosphaeria nubilosa]
MAGEMTEYDKISTGCETMVLEELMEDLATPTTAEIQQLNPKQNGWLTSQRSQDTSVEPLCSAVSCPSDKDECYLLTKLPRELRDAIYEYLVVFGQVSLARHQVPHQRPALLATCTQVRDEAMEIYHGRNTFVLYMDVTKESMTALPDWLEHLGRMEKQRIRAVEVKIALHVGLMAQLERKILCAAELHWAEDEDMREALEEECVLTAVAKTIDRSVVDAWLHGLRGIRDFDLRKVVVKVDRDGTYFEKIIEAWVEDFAGCVAAVVEGREPELKWVR